MKEIKGDIWDFKAKGHPIVVATNGDINGRGECVMGRGVALQAKRRYPALPGEIGTCLLNGGNRVRYFKKYNVFTFPVKHHYYEKADIRLLEWSARDLAGLVSGAKLKLKLPVYLPRVGCGNGKLRWEREVKPVLLKYLDDRFTVVELEIE